VTLSLYSCTEIVYKIYTCGRSVLYVFSGIYLAAPTKDSITHPIPAEVSSVCLCLCV